MLRGFRGWMRLGRRVIRCCGIRLLEIRVSGGTGSWRFRTTHMNLPVDGRKAIVWAAPIVFIPRTLWRTWGTRLSLQHGYGTDYLWTLESRADAGTSILDSAASR